MTIEILSTALIGVSLGLIWSGIYNFRLLKRLKSAVKRSDQWHDNWIEELEESWRERNKADELRQERDKWHGRWREVARKLVKANRDYYEATMDNERLEREKKNMVSLALYQNHIGELRQARDYWREKHTENFDRIEELKEECARAEKHPRCKSCGHFLPTECRECRQKEMREAMEDVIERMDSGEYENIQKVIEEDYDS